MSTPLKTRNIDFTRQTHGIVSHDLRTHSPNVLQCTSSVVMWWTAPALGIEVP